MGKKYLIFNADDFGVSPAHNEAIMELMEKKKIPQTSIMPVAPCYDEAAAWHIPVNGITRNGNGAP